MGWFFLTQRNRAFFLQMKTHPNWSGPWKNYNVVDGNPLVKLESWKACQLWHAPFVGGLDRHPGCTTLWANLTQHYPAGSVHGACVWVCVHNNRLATWGHGWRSRHQTLGECPRYPSLILEICGHWTGHNLESPKRNSQRPWAFGRKQKNQNQSDVDFHHTHGCTSTSCTSQGQPVCNIHPCIHKLLHWPHPWVTM